MAKFCTAIEGNTITKTLFFMGKEFSQVMTFNENGSGYAPASIDEGISRELPGCLEHIREQAGDMWCMDEDEIMELLREMNSLENEHAVK